MFKVTAAVSSQAALANAKHASFEETHHRESDGVSSSSKDNWRTRANNKTKVVVCRSIG